MNPYLSTNLDADHGTDTRLLAFRSVLVGVIAYHAFVLFLLVMPGERLASLLFLLNTPVMVAWVVRLRRGHPRNVVPGIVAAAVQVLLAIGFILNGGQPVAISVICGTITIGFLALAAVCYRFSGDSSQEDQPSRHALLFPVLVFCFTAAIYVWAYWGLTTRGRADEKELAEWGHRIIPRYANDTDLERWFFSPIHSLDRRLRPDHWSP
ncbi:hypothetical protein CA13_65450 [Planctomycetes bacterium CA13]|uniref:Uncharacterized protein n=2 Tax=Novipirellula herctigrandis TaxID=2527986 RepID=A0A5C5ZEU3_9BACT|nr:hypothetical protein CA13_65450 [Planctomycetes bacterium CA13]